MQRFYLPIRLAEKLSIRDAKMFHQISHVLRSRLGDGFTFFNGDGNEYSYRLEKISKESLEFTCTGASANVADPIMRIRLFQAIPNRYEKIDTILQKGVEAGISDFVFFRSQRSADLEFTDKKRERFASIIRESLEQCGGNRFPGFVFLERLDMDRYPGTKIVCHTASASDLSGSDIRRAEADLFVGPEGGWADGEIDEFRRAGAVFMHFGPRILRTESVGPMLAFSILWHRDGPLS